MIETLAAAFVAVSAALAYRLRTSPPRRLRRAARIASRIRAEVKADPRLRTRLHDAAEILGDRDLALALKLVGFPDPIAYADSVIQARKDARKGEP